MMHIDLALLQKYDRPGPRYTSYPTAPQFNEAFGPQSFLREIAATNHGNERGLSLYFHVPFCDTLCYFCACNMIITHDHKRIAEYLDHLEQEVRLVHAMLDHHRKVEQLHWGGGTPTYLTPDQIRRLGSFIRHHFSFTADAEISVEIDPRGLEHAHLEALREVGFNRASIGVQDFNPQVQQAVNRLQSFDLTKWTVTTLRALGFHSINLDLIYGLPLQSEKTFAETLEQILALAPDRLAIFNFAHVPWLKKHQRLILPEQLPAPDTKLRMLKYTIERLNQAGYVYIGMDHFAKPDDELTIAQSNGTLYRNFQGYSTHADCDLYAFGVTGISSLDRIYAQNLKDLQDYYQRLETGMLPTTKGYRLSADDRIRRHVINRLMCDMRLDVTGLSQSLDIDFSEYFAKELEHLQELERDGLLQRNNGQLEVTDMGRLLIRNIAMTFDAYLPKTQANGVFSRTV